jgi:hypothetical protein
MTTDVLNFGARNLATVQRYEERYADTTRPLADLVRIEDPAFYGWEELPMVFHS